MVFLLGTDITIRSSTTKYMSFINVLSLHIFSLFLFSSIRFTTQYKIREVREKKKGAEVTFEVSKTLI